MPSAAPLGKKNRVQPLLCWKKCLPLHPLSRNNLGERKRTEFFDRLRQTEEEYAASAANRRPGAGIPAP